MELVGRPLFIYLFLIFRLRLYARVLPLNVDQASSA